MDPTHLMTIAATITPMSVTARDETNDDVLTAGTPVATTCFLHQTGANERTAGVNTQEQTFTIYLPPGVSIDANDRITADGNTFEVIGPPARWNNPRARTRELISVTARKVA